MYASQNAHIARQIRLQPAFGAIFIALRSVVEGFRAGGEAVGGEPIFSTLEAQRRYDIGEIDCHPGGAALREVEHSHQQSLEAMRLRFF